MDHTSTLLRYISSRLQNLDIQEHWHFNPYLHLSTFYFCVYLYNTVWIQFGYFQCSALLMRLSVRPSAFSNKINMGLTHKDLFEDIGRNSRLLNITMLCILDIYTWPQQKTGTAMVLAGCRLQRVAEAGCWWASVNGFRKFMQLSFTNNPLSLSSAPSTATASIGRAIKTEH